VSSCIPEKGRGGVIFGSLTFGGSEELDDVELVGGGGKGGVGCLIGGGGGCCLAKSSI